MTQLIQITDTELGVIVENAVELAVKKIEENKPKEFKYLNVRDTCNFLSITTPTLLKYIKEGLIPAKMINGQYRIKSTDIEESLQTVKHNKYRRPVDRY